MRCLYPILLALLPCTAGAQLANEPFDRFAATGERAVLDEYRAKLASLPGTYRTRVLEARLTLLRGDAARALELGRALNRDAPDDLDVYAIVVDAALAVGAIASAEEAAQWMLNLRPEDVRTYRAVAAVRIALKDHEGAAQSLAEAFRRTLRTESALRAAILSDLGRVAARRGDPSLARRYALEALKAVPDYKPAKELL